MTSCADRLLREGGCFSSGVAGRVSACTAPASLRHPRPDPAGLPSRPALAGRLSALASVHFMPTGTSWLNQDKRCCALSTEVELGRGIHHSTQELEQTIRCNDDPSNGSSPPPTFSPQSNTSGCAPSMAQHNRRKSPGIQKRHTTDEVDGPAESGILSISKLNCILLSDTHLPKRNSRPVNPIFSVPVPPWIPSAWMYFCVWQ